MAVNADDDERQKGKKTNCVVIALLRISLSMSLSISLFHKFNSKTICRPLLIEFGLRPIYAHNSSFSPLPGIIVCLLTAPKL